MHYDEVMNNKSATGGKGGQGEGGRGLLSTVDVIIVPLSKKCAFGGDWWWLVVVGGRTAVVVVSCVFGDFSSLTFLFCCFSVC